ncbi:MAG: hypothetical protein DRO00_09390 [Thermoproteota archaeon]|nr:MAG: hypothetical protein DRO00_09390 [Candidatus Korarchaeota archaeon]
MGGKFDIKRAPKGARITMFEQGVRVIIISARFFVSIQRGIEDFFGEQAPAILYDSGIRAGSEAAKILIREWGSKDMDFLKQWSEFYSSKGIGWFKVKEINVDSDRQRGYIRIEQSFIVEEYGPSDRPVCDFMAGYIAGVLSEAFGASFSCEETKCIAKGDPYCEFVFERI